MQRPRNLLWGWFLAAVSAYCLTIIAAYIYQAFWQGNGYGGDYTAFWKPARALATQGRAALASLYDTTTLVTLLTGPPAKEMNWLTGGLPYLPVFYAYVLPFGYMGFGASFCAWLFVTGLLYMLAVATLPEFKTLHAAPHNIPLFLLILFVIVSPFSMFTLLCGESSFLFGALLIFGLHYFRSKPVWAGIAFGLLSAKPQLGLLLPMLILAEGGWICCASAAVTVLVLAAATTIWLGADVWVYWFHSVRLFNEAQERYHEPWIHLNASLYWMLHGRGVGVGLALAIQSVFGVLACWSVWMAARLRAPTGLRNALLITGIFIAAPHIMIYDMTICILPALLLVGWVMKGETLISEALALIILLVAPLLFVIPALKPLLSFVPLLFIVCLLCHLVFLRRLFALQTKHLSNC